MAPAGLGRALAACSVCREPGRLRAAECPAEPAWALPCGGRRTGQTLGWQDPLRPFLGGPLLLGRGHYRRRCPCPAFHGVCVSALSSLPENTQCNLGFPDSSAIAHCQQRQGLFHTPQEAQSPAPPCSTPRPRETHATRREFLQQATHSSLHRAKQSARTEKPTPRASTTVLHAEFLLTAGESTGVRVAPCP